MKFNTDYPQLPLQCVRRSLSDKIAWVETYLKEVETQIDVLNTAFVNAYINEFGVAHRFTMYGAFKCPDLGRTLKAGYDKGVFERGRIGLTEHLSGLPNWVYVYSLNGLRV